LFHYDKIRKSLYYILKKIKSINYKREKMQKLIFIFLILQGIYKKLL